MDTFMQKYHLYGCLLNQETTYKVTDVVSEKNVAKNNISLKNDTEKGFIVNGTSE